MSARKGSPNEYYKRKLEEIKEFINTAIANPDIVLNLSIIDGMAMQQGGLGIAVINIKVDIKEQNYHELKTKV